MSPDPAFRCVAVVDATLPCGLAANAVGVLAVTIGALEPNLLGGDLVDADGDRHPGLIPHGLPVLAATSKQLSELRERARAQGAGVVDFPRAGQQTTDYDELRRQVAELATADIAYLAVMIYGPRRALNKLTGNLPLLR